MKRCTHCGKEYPDDVMVCEVDAWPVIDIRQRNAILPPVLSAVIMLVLGGLVVFVGIYLTPVIMGTGEYAFDNITPIETANRLTETGGAIWAVFGPILPYILLGFMLALILRLSKKSRPALFTSFSLCILTCLYHLHSPMLKELGEQHHARGLAESPNRFAIFYFIVGLVVMLVIVARYGPFYTNGGPQPTAKTIHQMDARSGPLIRPFYYMLAIVVLAIVSWLIFSSPSIFSSQ